jgi:hypothetical protein
MMVLLMLPIPVVLLMSLCIRPCGAFRALRDERDDRKFELMMMAAQQNPGVPPVAKDEAPRWKNKLLALFAPVWAVWDCGTGSTVVRLSHSRSLTCPCGRHCRLGPSQLRLPATRRWRTRGTRHCPFRDECRVRRQYAADNSVCLAQRHHDRIARVCRLEGQALPRGCRGHSPRSGLIGGF